MMRCSSPTPVSRRQRSRLQRRRASAFALCGRRRRPATWRWLGASRSSRGSSITRAGLHEYNHQTDLYWETWDFLTPHLNIANAKWRGRVAVSLADVLLLKQVQLQVGAHKAVLITNSSFSPQTQYAA